ncbi:unnamed protein product [Pelagomonas calceolata]|uniref:3'-5' exonuclease domain-containing protein n=2 Tax=Pelagomonas calceolata TaxID=35677 RepID=A0A8J2SZ32_9STRA|nr:unnamed protein product [Pelagomonas calceolata]
MRLVRLASLMSALEPSTTRRSAGALRRLAGGDGDDAPAKLAAALHDENWRVQEIEACKDASGKGPLHFAAWRGAPKNCEILIDAGCDVEAPATGEFSYGKTPLFFAVTRCRDATVLALLARGAATKIVNNKGQSVRALAISHLKPETYRAVVDAEEADTRPWINWRETKSDGLTYGDLDARFLERPLEPRDVVDDVAVNPTTHISRRGAFLRKNPQRQQKQQAPPGKPPKPSTYAPSAPPADSEALLQAVSDASDEVETVGALEALATAWADRKGPWLPPLADAVAKVVPRDRLEAAAATLGEEGLAARLARRALGGAPRPPAPPPPPKAFQRRAKTPAAPPVDATLPPCALSGEPTWVDDDVGAVAAAVVTAKRVAFDCEFSAVPDRVATIQVALDDGRVFVVDGTLNLDPLVDALSARRVLGYGVGEDLKRLPRRDWSVDDLQRRFPRHKAPSLQRVVAEVLGEYVDKALQRSDWDSRPLSSEQLRYAALDAAVLLRLEAAFAT